jgi:hypothetical protein
MGCGLIQAGSLFTQHRVFTGFVSLTQQMLRISTKQHLTDFVMKIPCVACEVETEFLYIT